jgi:hypothetical protein
VRAVYGDRNALISITVRENVFMEQEYAAFSHHFMLPVTIMIHRKAVHDCTEKGYRALTTIAYLVV